MKAQVSSSRNPRAVADDCALRPSELDGVRGGIDTSDQLELSEFEKHERLHRPLNAYFDLE